MNDELLSKLLLGAVSGGLFYVVGGILFPWIVGSKNEKEKEPIDDTNSKTRQRSPQDEEPKNTKHSQSLDAQINQLNVEAEKAIDQINRLGKSGVFTDNEVTDKISKITNEKNSKATELIEENLIENVQKSKEFLELNELYEKDIITKEELEAKKLVLIERFRAKINKVEPQQKDEMPISISDNMKRLDDIIDDLKKHNRG